MVLRSFQGWRGKRSFKALACNMNSTMFQCFMNRCRRSIGVAVKVIWKSEGIAKIISLKMCLHRPSYSLFKTKRQSITQYFGETFCFSIRSFATICIFIFRLYSQAYQSKALKKKTSLRWQSVRTSLYNFILQNRARLIDFATLHKFIVRHMPARIGMQARMLWRKPWF